MTTIEAVQRSSGSPAAVWALLADASRWSKWGSWTEVYVEGGGEQGPGVERVLVTKPLFRVRERITEWVPEERLGYEMLEGMKVTGYRSAITLERSGDGTVVRWRSTYERAGVGTALLLRLAVQ